MFALTKSTELIIQALNFMEQSPMYGISYFPIKNRKNTDLLIGLDSSGISIYKPKDRVNPEINFAWPEVNSIAYDGKQLIINMLEKNCKPFLFYSTTENNNEQILITVKGNHRRWLSRRAPNEKTSIMIREAQVAQESENIKKKKFEQQKESELNFIHQSELIKKEGYIDEEEANKLKKTYDDAKRLLEEQLEEAKKAAEEERRKKEEAERELLEAQRRANELKRQAEIDDETKRKLTLLEYERLNSERAHKKEVEALNGKLQEFEDKYKKELNDVLNLRKQKCEDDALKSKGPELVPLSYNEIAKSRNAELRKDMDKFGTLARTKHRAQTEQEQQVERFTAGGRSKFETLKLLRKNNTRARIDEFECL
ncbi:Ezrin [Thelohanellus kitauei]|uniref:Ezrin n=1 Tax=Thelohanellus kitauei TaxID=669202 RepID=A0A0C2MCK5_THEKT|nr:Ezrin [Thelohanellus kitauei]